MIGFKKEKEEKEKRINTDGNYLFSLKHKCTKNDIICYKENATGEEYVYIHR